MKLLKRQVVFTLCILILLNSKAICQESPKTLKDSLLQFYSLEELSSMSSKKRWNIIREIRGLDPINYLADQPKTHDENGITIIADIPEAKAIRKIEERVSIIESEKENYYQEIYPNSWVDVQEGYFRSFYDNWKKRKVKNDYKELFINPKDSISIFSNLSKRIYYLNKDGDLRLVSIIYGYNVNKGKKWNWDDKIPLKYEERHYYIWNDTLQFYKEKFAEQRYDTEPSMYNLVTLDTANVFTSKQKEYYYKNNAFSIHDTEDLPFKRWNWEEKIDIVPYRVKGKGNSYRVIELRTILKEREEYKNGENDYLGPAKTSFISPYTIPPKE